MQQLYAHGHNEVTQFSHGSPSDRPEMTLCGLQDDNSKN